MQAQKTPGRVAWIELETFSPEDAAGWFCRELWFDRRPGGAAAVQNGNCRLLLAERHRPLRRYAPGTFFAGYEHLALEAPDIGEALDYCKGRGMRLETDGGKAFYNPKVWGTGMYYFNILTGFGIKVEISQRLDRPARRDGEKLVVGLEHLGVEVSDIRRSMRYYEGMGFSAGYPMVELPAAGGGRVLCAMMALGDTVLELFQFPGRTDYSEDANNAIRGLILDCEGAGRDCRRLATGPDGEQAVVC